MCTDLGLVSVNVIESFNSTLAKFRPKDQVWTAVDDTLASFLAFLSWQELHVSYSLGDAADYPHHEVEIADEVMRIMPGLDISFSEAEVVAMDAKLLKRIGDMAHWRDPERRAEKNRVRRVRKGWAKAGAQGYVGGGTSAGLQTAVAAALRLAPGAGLGEFYAGGLGVADFAAVEGAMTGAEPDVVDGGAANEESGEGGA
jgi:hypothetical protein